MYYAAMRPSEALALRSTDLQLPATEGEWGRIRIARGNPNIAGLWSDTGRREARQLKHRAAGAVRVVGAPPLLVTLLRRHLETYGAAQDGRLFRGSHGGSIRDEDYQNVWQGARRLAFPDAETSPLARRPYDLRHACVSLWLASGVDSAQVAAWAGHSVAVLHRVYAHVICGRENLTRAHIERALNPFWVSE
jgi:integrase